MKAGSFLKRSIMRQLTVWQLAALMVVSAIGLSGMSQALAQTQPNPKDPPQVFVEQVVAQLIDVVKKDELARKQDLARVNEIVEKHILPYVNLEKTTRLAAGRYWRDATAQQQKALVDAFRMTLVRTYSGALTRVDSGTSMTVMPFRSDANTDDVVVQSQVVESSNSSPIRIDYRLEKTPQGWKIYDLNVENIWLIQNYRNQFSQEISRGGIDGLIAALNKRNSTN